MLFFDMENHGFGSILLNFLLCVYVDEERLIWVGFFCRLRKILRVITMLFLQSEKLCLLKGMKERRKSGFRKITIGFSGFEPKKPDPNRTETGRFGPVPVQFGSLFSIFFPSSLVVF